MGSSTTTHGDSHSCDSLSIDSLEHIVFVFTLRPPFARSQSQTSFSDGFHRGKRSPVFSTRCWHLLRNLPPSQAFLRIEIGRNQQKYEHKQSLINQAKAEFSKKNAPASAKTASGGIISDPNDSRFDLEAYLNDLDAKTS